MQHIYHFLILYDIYTFFYFVKVIIKVFMDFFLCIDLILIIILFNFERVFERCIYVNLVLN